MAIFKKKCYSYTWHGPVDQGYETTEIYYVTLRPKSYTVDGFKIKIDIDDDTLIWDIGSNLEEAQYITVRSYMTDEDLTLKISSESDDPIVDNILSKRDKLVIKKITNDLYNKCKGLKQLKQLKNVVVENVEDNHVTIILLGDKYREVDMTSENYCECENCPHKEICDCFCDKIISALNTKKETIKLSIQNIFETTKPCGFLDKVIEFCDKTLFKNGLDLDSDEAFIEVNKKKIQIMKLKNTFYGVSCYELLEIELDDAGMLYNIELKLLLRKD